MEHDLVNTTPEQVGQRIREARTAAGLTQDEVAAELAARGVSLTKAGLSKYERGGSMPKASLLIILADIFGVNSRYFFEERSAHVEWLAFRKATSLSTKSQDRIKGVAEELVSTFITLQASLEPTRSHKPLDRQNVQSVEDAESAAESVRKAWRLGDSPIDSVTTAIEDNGGVVVEIDGDGDLFDGLSGWANKTAPVIVISKSLTDDRRRFSLAHELGHLVMVTGDIDDKLEEKLAHRFAASFIVPAKAAKRELGERRRHLDLRELAILKQKHGLSMQAWIYRAADLGIIEESHMRTLFAEMTRLGWRRTEPVPFKGREQPVRLRQLTVRALAEGLLSPTQSERIVPGITQDSAAATATPPTKVGARALLRLPKEERDQVMERAAALMENEYRDGGPLREFDAEGDLIDDDD